MTFLYLVPTGMNDPEQPTWGSWAGRYGPMDGFAGRSYCWANQADAWGGTTNRDNTLRRWAADLQNDFRARLDWCVKPFAEANHPPEAKVEGPRQRVVSPGSEVPLSARGSRDPDGHLLAYEWFVYREAGSYRGTVILWNPDTNRASFVAPGVSSPETVHVLLRVTDNGVPSLSRYQRVIVTVDPQRN